MDRSAERTAPFKPTTPRRSTIAHWPSPDERALFDTIERIDIYRGNRRPHGLNLARVTGYGIDLVVALAVSLGTFGAGVGMAHALTSLPL
ncbi:hypothetical protein [Anianabacter salinae]|uniref:hypothetical protein n=1 Tax=Anianabacter salinae TaxID=2851023 RepID=UPI00225E1264|nr:hypothetical protein [Anianabacter salinae]MBV0912921.1 hypothetical protein [Anianabacter salinae]